MGLGESEIRVARVVAIIAGISSYPMASIQGGWSDIQETF